MIGNRTFIYVDLKDGVLKLKDKNYPLEHFDMEFTGNYRSSRPGLKQRHVRLSFRDFGSYVKEEMLATLFDEQFIINVMGWPGQGETSFEFDVALLSSESGVGRGDILSGQSDYVEYNLGFLVLR